MTIESSGRLGLNGCCTGGTNSRNQIATEVGDTARTRASLNDSNLRTLASKPSGLIRFSDFYGKSSRATKTYTFTANSNCVGLNVATASYTGSVAGLSISGSYSSGNTCVIVNINSGIYIYSTNPSLPALKLTGATSGDTLTINNAGYILGGGGTGGSPHYCSFNYNISPTNMTGSPGGIALCYQSTGAAIKYIYNTGAIAGGGGGGAGGSNIFCSFHCCCTLGHTCHSYWYTPVAGGGGAGGGNGGSITYHTGGSCVTHGGGYPGGLNGAGGNGNTYCATCGWVATGAGGGRGTSSAAGGTVTGLPVVRNSYCNVCHSSIHVNGGYAGGAGGTVWRMSPWCGFQFGQGGNGGSCNNAGGSGCSASAACGHGGGGGGGYGAAGGNSYADIQGIGTTSGGAGGAAVKSNGTVIWKCGVTGTIAGAVS